MEDVSEAATTQVSAPLPCEEEGPGVTGEVTDIKSPAGATTVSTEEEQPMMSENSNGDMKGPVEVPPPEASTAATDQVDTTGEGTSED